MVETVDQAIRELEDFPEKQTKCFVFSDLLEGESYFRTLPLIGFQAPIVGKSRRFNAEERAEYRFFPKQNIDLVGINLIPNTYHLPDGYTRPRPDMYDYSVCYIPKRSLTRIIKLGKKDLCDFYLKDNMTISCSYSIQTEENNQGRINREIPLTSFRKGFCFLSDRVQDKLMWSEIGRAFFRQFVSQWHEDAEKKSKSGAKPLESILAAEPLYELHNMIPPGVFRLCINKAYYPEKPPPDIEIAMSFSDLDILSTQTLNQLITTSIEALNRGDEIFLDNLFSRVRERLRRYSGAIWYINHAKRYTDGGDVYQRDLEMLIRDIKKMGEPYEVVLVDLVEQALQIDGPNRIEALDALKEKLRSKVILD